MKRKYSALCLVLMIGAGGWLATSLAQRNAPFDVRETHKELEILEGILSTTLRYAIGDSTRTRRGVVQFGRSNEIESFYLYGQGAVFMIPNSHTAQSSRLADLEEIAELIDQLEQKEATTDSYLRSLERRIQRRGRAAVLDGFQFEYLPVPEPPNAPEPPEPPIAPRASGVRIEEPAYAQLAEAFALAEGRRGKEVSGEDLKKWIETNRTTLQKEQRESEQAQAEREAREQKIQDTVISALAQHGDSLSAITPNEYVSLIFLNSSAGFEAFTSSRRSRSGALVISVQMSQLSELKQGSITLNQLRERLIQYEL